MNKSNLNTLKWLFLSFVLYIAFLALKACYIAGLRCFVPVLSAEMRGSERVCSRDEETDREKDEFGLKFYFKNLCWHPLNAQIFITDIIHINIKIILNVFVYSGL